MGYFNVIYYDGERTRARRTYAEDEYSAIEKVRNNKENTVVTVYSVWQQVLHREPGESGLIENE